MRTWERVKLVARCGGCGEVLGEGMAMQLIQFDGVKHRLVRCEQCAEGPAPPDLPAHIESGRSTKPMQPLAVTAKKITQRNEWMPYKG